MHGPSQGFSSRALLICLGITTVVLVSLTQWDLISRRAKRFSHQVGDALDDLDLDKPSFGFEHGLQAPSTAHNEQDAKSSLGSHMAGEVHGVAEKVGAGMLLVTHSGWALLLKRRSKHNDATWGLPGGNQDLEDGGDLLVTTKREAVEEMGKLPDNYTIRGSILTRRGKRLQKHYTVFIADIDDVEKDRFQPELDPKEHSDWRWFKIQDLKRLQAAAEGDSSVVPAQGSTRMGPAMPTAPASTGQGVSHPRSGTAGSRAVSTAEIGSRQSDTGQGHSAANDLADVELHPVVALVLGPQYTTTLGALLPVAD